MARKIRIHTHTFDTAPVIGEFVSGTSRIVFTGGEEVLGTFDGIYEGVREDSGIDYHMFRDGHLNGSAQAHHGFPVEAAMRTTPEGQNDEYRPTTYDGTPEALLDYIANWYPARGMSQDLPGVPSSRVPLSDAPALRSLIADGKVVTEVLRGKTFYTVA